MNVLEALKTLYVGGGGDASDLDEISGNKDPNMINAIYGDGLNTRLSEGVADNVRSIASGGGGLPEVTSEDNGDVLKVVNGEWDKANPDYTIKDIIIIPTQENDIVWEVTA